MAPEASSGTSTQLFPPTVHQRAFHAKLGSIKDRNAMDLTDADGIKKRWQEYTEEQYKKSFMAQIITMV